MPQIDGAGVTSAVRAADGDAVVSVSGDVDLAGVERFRTAVAEGLDRAGQRVVVDLGGVQLLTSAGLGVLAEMHEKARAGRRELVVRTAGAPRIVRQAIAAVGLDRVLTVQG